MNSYSPGIPSSFDPTLLNSELEILDATKSCSYSDDIDAIHQCLAEDKAKKTNAGVVIQHRIWRTKDAFRSEEDNPIDTPIKFTSHATIACFPTASSTDSWFPSSPPAMALTSSPISYPQSSVANPTSPNKRKRSDDGRSPLQGVLGNNAKRRVGAFLDDSDDEDDIAALNEHALKRRVINSVKDLPALPADLTEHTPPLSQGEFMDYDMTPPETVNYFEVSSQPNASKAEGAFVPPTTGKMARTASGKPFYIPKKINRATLSYERLIASRSDGPDNQARQCYYGINVHRLIDEAKVLDEEMAAAKENRAMQYDAAQPSIEQPVTGKRGRTLMWTEKYRAKKFTDLVGDERTHRSVLRWLKSWDPIVFPGAAKQNPKKSRKGQEEEEQKHRKILLLTGPPGLGKTTLAHVCARQAGYEVQEINASDERSKDVVKGRIRDMVGTENVRGIDTNTAHGKVRKAGKPVCVVVDEVDGVVSGSGGGGEGGFVKALIDLIHLDEKNSKTIGQQASSEPKRKKKGDKFRLLRPLVLICNDVYHPSLRPLRQSSLAEIVHIRKPALNMVVSRIQEVFTREGIPCDSDGVRRLCEATWGVSTKKEGNSGSGTGEGDIRGVMVVSEWIAGRFRSSIDPKARETPRLTRRWIEENVINDLGHQGGAARSLGRGGAKDVVDRVFREGAGFPKQAETTDVNTAAARAKQGVIGVAESAKRRAMERLREMVDTSGDCDRIVTDCFTAYPAKPYHDDNYFTKPTAAYEWLHFHDTLSSAVHGSQEWELAPYLSQSVLAFHNLFASPRQQSSNPIIDPDAETSAFSGPGANFMAAEELRKNRSQLMALQGTLSLPLTRLFRSPEELAAELIPYVLRMLSPDVKPVIVNTGPSGSKSTATASVRKSSEKMLVKKAVEAMAATGVRFERSRVEIEDLANRTGGWVFRMEPPLDSLAAFETLAMKRDDKVRYAVRSVLETEWKKESARMDGEARKRRGGQLDADEVVEEAKGDVDKEEAAKQSKSHVKKDFFGRAIVEQPLAPGEKRKEPKTAKTNNDERIWVSFHEGYSNAVRKPITIDELMRGL